MRRFLEQEELEFGRGVDGKSDILGALENAAQQSARTQRLSRAGEFGEEEQHVALDRNRAAGLRQDAAGRVGIGGVPAGEGGIVVELVVGIPAQHDVAEAEAVIERGEEFLARDIFAAQHAVEIDDADLDVAEVALLDQTARVGARLHIVRSHQTLPSKPW